ncbi:MAG: uroporphyrinogen-III synthase [Moraxella sp.]|nr:uroporphyrinogen-III synthase [Moraxella sp.]
MSVFVNTRPTDDDGFTKLGMPSVHLPLLTITPFDTLSEQENAHLTRFIKGEIGMVVVVSVQAVRCAVAFLKKQGIHHAHDLPHRPTMIAVGEPTKHALAQFGFDVITPNEQGLPMSNEGMIQLPILANLGKDDTVMIWRGVGGRRLLSDTLSERGVNVVAIAFYQRSAPLDLGERFDDFYQALPSHTPLFVLISSGTSLDGWRHFDRHTHPTTFLALGDRLTALTRQHYPDNTVICVDDLHPNTLLTALNQTS